MGRAITGKKRSASPHAAIQTDLRKRHRSDGSDDDSDAGTEAEYSETEVIQQGQQVSLARLERNLNLMVRRVRSALKATRQGEVLRAIKRVQTTKGTTTKDNADLEVLVKELDVTKHVPLDILACRVAARKLVRARILPKAKVLRESAGEITVQQEYPLLCIPRTKPQGGDLIAALFTEAHGALEERVYERFTSSKLVAAAATAGVEKLEALLRRPTQKDVSLVAETPDHKSTGKEAERSKKTQEEEAPPILESQSGLDDDVEEQDPDEIPEFGDEWDVMVGSGSEGETELDGDGPLPESDYDDPASEGENAPEGAAESEDASTDDESGSDSGSDGGLPSLAAGYVDRGVRLSGMGDASDYSDAEADLAADGGVQVRKNRMGQRARRALWEKKFGRGAKHVQSGMAARGRDRPARGGRTGGRVGHNSGGGRGGMAPRSRGGFAPRGGYSSGRPNANETPLGPRPATKPKTEDKPVHPSWVAKQQQKKQAEAKPQGKKVVFD